MPVVIINGKSIHLQKETGLQSYLEDNGYDLERIAVEKNGVIISKSNFALEIIRDDDTLEIVGFVGGG